jgi:hypothetical protein
VIWSTKVVVGAAVSKPGSKDAQRLADKQTDLVFFLATGTKTIVSTVHMYIY